MTATDLTARDAVASRRPELGARRGRPSLTHRSNNFDFLRLVGALLVVLGHGYVLAGVAIHPPKMAGYEVQTLGVVIFFSISGYLITASWSRTRDVLAYVAARCLRIFPALVAVVIVTAYVLGPLVTVLPAGDYVRHEMTTHYLDNIILQPVFALPGVFADLPYANAVNGSLWTLPAEFFCYLVVPIVLVLPRSARPVVVMGLLLASLWYSLSAGPGSMIIHGTRISDAAGMWVFFAAGVMLRLAHERRASLFRADVAAGLFAAYVTVVAVEPTWVAHVSWIALPYVALTVGLAGTPCLRRAARFGDLSYGIYLWAFPVQQTVIHLVGVQAMAVNLVLVAVGSALLALISWHVIEKPALRLKSRVPRIADVSLRSSSRG